MPKINAPSMADVSTEFVLIEPGTKQFKILEAPVNTNGGRQNVAIKLEVQDPGDDHGRTVKDTIHLHKKNGEENPVGLAQLKRYFEAVLGQEQVATMASADYDTDMIVGGIVLGEVYIEQFPKMKKVGDTYTDEQETDPKTGEPIFIKSNKVKNIVGV